MDPIRNARISELLGLVGAVSLKKDSPTTLGEVLEDAGIYGEPCWESAPEQPPPIQLVFQLPPEMMHLGSLSGMPSASHMHPLQARLAQPIPQTAQQMLDAAKCGSPKPQRNSPNITPPSSTESPSRMVESQ